MAAEEGPLLLHLLGQSGSFRARLSVTTEWKERMQKKTLGTWNGKREEGVGSVYTDTRELKRIESVSLSVELFGFVSHFKLSI